MVVKIPHNYMPNTRLIRKKLNCFIYLRPFMYQTVLNALYVLRNSQHIQHVLLVVASPKRTNWTWIWLKKIRYKSSDCIEIEQLCGTTLSSAVTEQAQHGSEAFTALTRNISLLHIHYIKYSSISSSIEVPYRRLGFLLQFFYSI